MAMAAGTRLQASDLPAIQDTEDTVSPELLEKYSGVDGLTDRLTDLGIWLRGCFEETSAEKVLIEDRMLMDLRQYKGLYEPEETQRLRENKTRSRLFSRITRRKVKAFDSRMMEMLFPAGKDRNWDMKSTPEPDMVGSPVAQEMIAKRQQAMFQEHVQQLAQQTGQDPQMVSQKLLRGGFQPELDPDELRHISMSVSKSACERMNQTVADQLAELQYKISCKEVLHSGHLYGTGLIKGPLAQKKMRPGWQMVEGQWQSVMQAQLFPFIEFVSVWSWYPDMAAKVIDDCEFQYQRHVYTKAQVAKLGMRPGFDLELLRRYLIQFPDGDADIKGWETLLDAEDERNYTTKERTNKRYEVLEYWGVLNDAQVRDLGLEPDPLEPIWVNIWVIGHFVIRFGAAPISGMNHPFHAYYFDKDETSIFGEGVPAIMRDDQSALNGTVRAMMDNMASTVGPQYEVNTDMLHPGEKTRETYPGRVWYRRGDGRFPALRSVDVPSRIQEFLALKGTFEQQIHENTLPAYMQGGQSGGAGRTASGLSMLMGSANLDVKDQIINFDLGITRPLIRGFYQWNMQFNDDPNIKGDYEVVAKGSSSLVAKEIRSTQLDQLLPLLSNPAYVNYIDKRKLLEEIFKVRDLTDSEILLAPNEFDEQQALRQQLSQLQQQLAQGSELIEMLWKIAPNLVRQAFDRMGPESMALTQSLQNGLAQSGG